MDNVKECEKKFIIIIWQFKQRIIDLGDSVFTFSSTCRVSNS